MLNRNRINVVAKMYNFSNSKFTFFVVGSPSPPALPSPKLEGRMRRCSRPHAGQVHHGADHHRVQHDAHRAIKIGGRIFGHLDQGD